MASSNRRAQRTLRKCQQSCGERRCGLLRPGLFVDRELKVGKTREACLGFENAQARDDRALRKRRNGEARKRRRTHACQARARVDDLPGEFAILERGERRLARYRLLAIKRQRRRRVKRFARPLDDVAPRRRRAFRQGRVEEAMAIEVIGERCLRRVILQRLRPLADQRKPYRGWI